MTQDGVTIILCCFNSEQRLPTTLKHIADQIEIKDAIIEVILVDNRCTDGTVDLFNKWSQTLTGNFFTRIVREETPGLMAARLCGVRHASHETMIFCDDDNWLSPTYCQIALHTLIDNPDVGLAGGNSLAEPECTPPAWFGAIS
jgi:glycosyltransferase involved in cell wall biosynthesis